MWMLCRFGVDLEIDVGDLPQFLLSVYLEQANFMILCFIILLISVQNVIHLSAALGNIVLSIEN